MQGEQFQDQTDKFIKYTQDNKSHTFPSVPSQCLLEIYILPGKLTVMSALFTITTNKISHLYYQDYNGVYMMKRTSPMQVVSQQSMLTRNINLTRKTNTVTSVPLTSMTNRNFSPVFLGLQWGIFQKLKSRVPSLQKKNIFSITNSILKLYYIITRN